MWELIYSFWILHSKEKFYVVYSYFLDGNSIFMIWLLKGKIILRQMKDDFNLSLENLFFVLITIYNYNFFLNIEKSLKNRHTHYLHEIIIKKIYEQKTKKNNQNLWKN